MKLSSVIKQMDILEIQGSLDHDITSIEHNSNNVQAGSLFIAVSGFVTAGYYYIDEAIERGASAIITDRQTDIKPNVTFIKVSSTRKAMACAAANFNDHPSERLNMIGVTGTNGKTSVTHFLQQIFKAAHVPTSLIGTMGTIINDEKMDSNLTTPEAPELQMLLKKIADHNSSSCVMEVSSHSLDLDRVACTSYNTAIFTNLTPDHLELHGNMASYFQAKAKLFTYNTDFSIVNADDPYGRQLIDLVPKNMLVTYGIYQKAHIYPSDITYTTNGSTFMAHTPSGSIRIRVHLPGEIYVYNSLAAIATAFANEIPLNTIQTGIEHVKGIRGRMETVYEQDDFKVVIDFAHTEDALKRTLKSLKPFVKGRLILVFGVYADTSPSGTKKRYGMGKVAAEYADYTVLTLDNPKESDQALIMQETSEAIKEHHGRFTAEKDREKAIFHAISSSQENDTVVLAGKGHEDTQVIGKEQLPFNEKEVVIKAINKLKVSKSIIN